jgi:hypothetical protein
MIPQTDLSEGVLAVLVKGPVIVSGHRAADSVSRFVVNINTKSIFLQKLNAFSWFSMKNVILAERGINF